MQYVTTQSIGTENRYVVGQIDQKTYQMQIRLNWNINPNLSISYWGQPFMTTGTYTNYKNMLNSNASEYSDRFHQFTSNELSYDPDNEIYMVDENQDGSTDYEFYNPDFNFLQFRSNAVLRWEYKPGSALFVVWSQNRSANPALTAVENSLGGLTEELFTISPRNTFLIKYTYRFVF
jgi:hypothetical protein